MKINDVELTLDTKEQKIYAQLLADLVQDGARVKADQVSLDRQVISGH